MGTRGETGGRGRRAVGGRAVPGAGYLQASKESTARRERRGFRARARKAEPLILNQGCCLFACCLQRALACFSAAQHKSVEWHGPCPRRVHLPSAPVSFPIRPSQSALLTRQIHLDMSLLPPHNSLCHASTRPSPGSSPAKPTSPPPRAPAPIPGHLYLNQSYRRMRFEVSTPPVPLRRPTNGA